MIQLYDTVMRNGDTLSVRYVETHEGWTMKRDRIYLFGWPLRLLPHYWYGRLLGVVDRLRR